MTNRKSIVELDYGILDPLEVARQVAIEVERELVDFREQSCSSSEKAPEGKLQEPDSPDFLSGKRSHASKGSPEEVAHDPDLSAEALPMQEEESATSSENLDTEPIDDTQDVETSQVSEVAQEEANTVRGLCNFDLNQEVCSEDTDPPGNQISTTVSIVSASRATAAPGLPVAPLQFEGKFGWKGSAATSAFRPASPRRMPEGDKDLSTGESSSCSKQRQGCLDIDLNIAESEDDRIGDLLPDKQVPVSSTLLSGESSVEANSRSERLELDLNRASEDGDVPSDWQINGQLFPKRNGHHSQALSSSSSLKQPSLRNIDLNDQPSFLNDYSDHSYLTKLPQNLNASGNLKSDNSVISIMGTRVEVKRRDFVPHTLPSQNGRTPELAFDINLARTGSFLGMGSAPPYAHSTLYNYNGISPGHAMPFSTMYGAAGPIPYMVDSRGAPVVPQIVGSPSALPPVFSQQPFLVSMTSSTLSNGVMPSQGSFDIDSRMMLEGGSMGPAGLGLLSNSGPFRSTDEQLRSYSQPSISSVVGEKRKEQDGGWEYYPFKHYTPPWKQG
ncbi:Transcription elongation factor (TFIIS) family protein [Forsythia ovata]|uniref:Transcription elongation factor (TFIIS) family protein n=1 Tax=Forsythia ovata TaxID=205694 RepID=A0ABD1PXC8_9LAMI